MYVVELMYDLLNTGWGMEQGAEVCSFYLLICDNSSFCTDQHSAL